MKTVHRNLITLLLLFGLTSAACAADTYIIDPTHSTIGFSVKHLTVSEVQGNFKTFTGSITLEPKDASATKVEAVIETKSINTQNEQRDNHLRSADFFDAQTNPDITFKSVSVTKKDNTYNIVGELTIKGVTKQITLPLTIAGPVKNPMGDDTVIGASGQTKINRQDFGVKWNKQMDQSGYLIGDEVLILINLEAHKK